MLDKSLVTNQLTPKTIIRDRAAGPIENQIIWRISQKSLRIISYGSRLKTIYDGSVISKVSGSTFNPENIIRKRETAAQIKLKTNNTIIRFLLIFSIVRMLRIGCK
jgi:hypothetical protein